MHNNSAVLATFYSNFYCTLISSESLVSMLSLALAIVSVGTRVALQLDPTNPYDTDCKPILEVKSLQSSPGQRICCSSSPSDEI